MPTVRAATSVSAVERMTMLDPMLADEIVHLLAPHSEGCQDPECVMCDDAIAMSARIVGLFRDVLLRDETVEAMARATWAEWESLPEDVRCHLRNHLLRHVVLAADVLVPVPVAAAVEAS
jgi:hypothetical protein